MEDEVRRVVNGVADVDSGKSVVTRRGESVMSFLHAIQTTALAMGKRKFFTPEQLRQHRLDNKSLKKMLKKEGKI